MLSGDGSWREGASTPLLVRHGRLGQLRGHHIPRHVVIPYDEQLKQMLDQGTYVCERLERRTRLAVKQLALAAHDQLV